MAWTKLAYKGTTAKGNSSDKVWKVQVVGKKLTTVWGRNGKWLRQTVKSFSSPAEAKQAKAKLVKQKKSKGYSPTRVTFKASGKSFKRRRRNPAAANDGTKSKKLTKREKTAAKRERAKAAKSKKLARAKAKKAKARERAKKAKARERAKRAKARERAKKAKARAKAKAAKAKARAKAKAAKAKAKAKKK